MESLSRLALSDDNNPNEFDLTVASLLVGLGAEQYIDAFRKNNISQYTLTELSDEDLIKIGVDDGQIRAKIIEEVKTLPLYEENAIDQNSDGLDVIEVGAILTETSQHLHRLYLSLKSNRLALRKTKELRDCLLFRDLYASHVATRTLDSLYRTLDSMEQALTTDLKVNTPKQKTRRRKVAVGAAGGTVVVLLAILLFQSLKRL